MKISSIKNIKTKLIGKKIYLYREISSTNDEAKRLLKLGVGEGAVVIAEGQSKGRGKPGRSWISPCGKGVYLTIIIQPFRTQGMTMPLTLLGTLAGARAVKGLRGLDVMLKWPNDMMVYGRKLGGVLTEMRSKAVLVGIGINVNSRSEELPENSTSIYEELGKKTGRTVLIKRLLEEFEKLYFLLLAGKNELIINEWKTLSDCDRIIEFKGR